MGAERRSASGVQTERERAVRKEPAVEIGAAIVRYFVSRGSRRRISARARIAHWRAKYGGSSGGLTPANRVRSARSAKSCSWQVAHDCRCWSHAVRLVGPRPAWLRSNSRHVSDTGKTSPDVDIPPRSRRGVAPWYPIDVGRGLSGCGRYARHEKDRPGRVFSGLRHARLRPVPPAGKQGRRRDVFGG